MMILDRVVPFGRSKTEYELMFALTESDRLKSIVGIGDGPASFNAEMTVAGYQVTSIRYINLLAQKLKIVLMLA